MVLRAMRMDKISRDERGTTPRSRDQGDEGEVAKETGKERPVKWKRTEGDVWASQKSVLRRE